MSDEYPLLRDQRLGYPQHHKSTFKYLVLLYEQNRFIKVQPAFMTQLELQPTLNLFGRPAEYAPSALDRHPTKLYLVPTTHGESYDPDFAPNPSPLSELPNLERWTLTYVVTIIEIMAGRRPVQQVARSTHRFTYNTLLKLIGGINEVPKIRRIHRNQPIEGVVELTAILVFKNRVRALAARFEGVDRKWLCTELELL